MNALEWLGKHPDAEGSDLLREMVRCFAERLMAAEVDAVCGAAWPARPWSSPSPTRAASTQCGRR